MRSRVPRRLRIRGRADEYPQRDERSDQRAHAEYQSSRVPAIYVEVLFLGRLNQRKNRMTKTAGISGPHQASRPNALSAFDPSFTNSMIEPAHANALARFNRLNFSGRTFAYAHATGIAVRSPGRNRPDRIMSASREGTRSLPASRYFASLGYRSSQWMRPRRR